MRRNVIAAVVQLVGIVMIVAASFAVSWKVGVIAVGALLVLVGLDLEGDG